ncbi:hypothetical protein ACFE04_004446 [Oxalis oulophora]
MEMPKKRKRTSKRFSSVDGSSTHLDHMMHPPSTPRSDTGLSAFISAWGINRIDSILNSPSISMDYIEHDVRPMEISCAHSLTEPQLYTEGSHSMAAVRYLSYI